jgi:copper chaperone
MYMTGIAETIETREYAVAGMSCSHCVLSVQEAVSAVPGVIGVAVDPHSGRLTVTGTDVDAVVVRGASLRLGMK